MKITVRLKESTIKRNLQKIKHMLLFGEIKLSSICRSQRIANKSLYIMAFRASVARADYEEYTQTLRILANDMLLCEDDYLKKSLYNLLENYWESVWFTLNKNNVVSDLPASLGFTLGTPGKGKAFHKEVMKKDSMGCKNNDN